MSAQSRSAQLPPLRPWPVILLLAALLVLPGCAGRDRTPGACRLPPRATTSVPRFVHPSTAHYLQRDKRWSEEPIGGSGKPLRTVGCVVCSLSMALAQHGIALPPARLNQELKKVDGFTSQGWLYWPAIAQVTAGRARAEIIWKPTLQAIEAALAAGHPVIVKVAPPPMLQHWVVLVGREGREFLMRDPLDTVPAVRPLSAIGSDILAVRIVKPLP